MIKAEMTGSKSILKNGRLNVTSERQNVSDGQLRDLLLTSDGANARVHVRACFIDDHLQHE